MARHSSWKVHGRRAKILAAATVTALTAAACGGDGGGEGGGSGSDPVKVGVVLSMSGTYAAYGEEMLAALELTVDRINEEGGVEGLDGAPIELVVADDASEPSRTANEARRLVTTEDVSMLAGFPITPLYQALSAVADQYQMPTLSFGAGAARGLCGYTLGFPYDEGYAASFVNYLDYLAKDQGQDIKRVVLASSNNETGQAVDEAAERRLEELGYEVLERVPLDPQATDLTPSLLRIRDMDPDAVISFLYVRDGLLLQQARYTVGYEGPVWIGGTGGYTDPVLWEELGEEVALATLPVRVFGLSGFSDALSYEPLQAMIEQAEEAGVEVPVATNYTYGVQAAYVIEAAVSNAGSREPAAICEGLGDVDLAFGEPEAVMPREGGVSFSEEGVLTDVQGLITQWTTEGEQEVVFPEVFAVTEPALG